jgi:hypothetical protein
MLEIFFGSFGIFMIPEGFGQTIKGWICFFQNFALWKNSNIGKTFGHFWKFFTSV